MQVRGPSRGALTLKVSVLPGVKAVAGAFKGSGVDSPAGQQKEAYKLGVQAWEPSL